MSQAMELRPPTEAGEVETLTFDYGPALGVGETVTSVEAFLCAVIQGTDVASGHLIGNSIITASPSSGLPNQAVVQQVGTMKGGVTYQYQCRVVTSFGQKLQLRANLPCVVVPTGSANT